MLALQQSKWNISDAYLSVKKIIRLDISLSPTVIHGQPAGCHIDSDPECISASTEEFI